MSSQQVADADRVADLARGVVTDHDPKKVPIPEFLGACYDAGLSWVHFPRARVGWACPAACRRWPTRSCGAPAAGCHWDSTRWAAGPARPPSRRHAQSDGLKKQLLRPLATTGTSGASCSRAVPAPMSRLATSAIQDRDDWVINGQRCGPASRHRARGGACCLARSSPDLPKHRA